MYRKILLVAALLSGFKISLALAQNTGEWSSHAQAKILYLKMCASCHGPDGRPSVELQETLRPAPSDLSRLPYRYGSSEAEIAETIRIGRGENMFRFNNRLADEQIIMLAQYVRTLIADQPSSAEQPESPGE